MFKSVRKPKVIILVSGLTLIFFCLYCIIHPDLYQIEINPGKLLPPQINLTEKSKSLWRSSKDWPYAGDIAKYVNQLRMGERPDAYPPNLYTYKFLVNIPPVNITNDDCRFLLLIKSAATNFERRKAIREVWGNLKSPVPGVSILRTFFIGRMPYNNINISKELEEECNKFKDIVQIDYKDTYFNNTIKTMCEFRWAVEYLPKCHYYFFVDDDMYVNVRNLIAFVANPAKYEQIVKNNTSIDVKSIIKGANKEYFAGHIFFHPVPVRHCKKKWYISWEQYPVERFPSFATAGSYIVSNKTLHTIYYTSMYTKHFHFDDVYLGFVAEKANVSWTEFNPYYANHQYQRYGAVNYPLMIATHGHGSIQKMAKLWMDYARKYTHETPRVTANNTKLKS